MLPTTDDNGARLAAVLPTGIAALAHAHGHDATDVLMTALGKQATDVQVGDADRVAAAALTNLLPTNMTSLVLIVVDGLGYSNLRETRGHARTLAAMQQRRITTVIPSTTAAALTTITTGSLPGTHGLVGYQIRHPELGLLRPLNDWDEIDEATQWQRSTSLFHLARTLGVRPVAVGRPAHAESGLTRSILSGADYMDGQTIQERFARVSQLTRQSDPFLAYVYVDELDRVGHSDGWKSEKWVRRLEDLDAALSDLLRTLPSDVGVILTADHGMINSDADQQIVLDDSALEGVKEVGGEPRFRSFYTDPQHEPELVIERLQAALGASAWVISRENAIERGWFGEISPEVTKRLGEVLAVARGRYALNLGSSGGGSSMLGQHGGLNDEERGVPFAVAGALAGSGFARAVSIASSFVA